MSIVIRNINKEDLSSISLLHKKVFDKSYFSVYYSINDLNNYFKSLIKMNDYCFIAELNNKIAGYLIGGEKTQIAVDQFLLENRLRIVYYIFRYPKLMLIVLRKIFRKYFGDKKNSKTRLRLFLIGVDPQFTRQGVGNKLIERFEISLRKNGFNCYGLYVKKNNYNAIKFYDKNGFQKEFGTGDLFSYIKNI